MLFRKPASSFLGRAFLGLCGPDMRCQLNLARNASIYLALLFFVTIAFARLPFAFGASSSLSVPGWCENGVFAVSHTIPALVSQATRSIVHAHGCHMETIVGVRTSMDRHVTIISVTPTVVVMEMPPWLDQGFAPLTFVDHHEREQAYDDLLFIVKSDIVNSSPSLYVSSVRQETTFYFSFLAPGIYDVVFGDYNVTVLSTTPSAITVAIEPRAMPVYDVTVHVRKISSSGKAAIVASLSPANFPVAPPLSTAVARIEPNVIVSDRAFTLKLHGIGLDHVALVEVGTVPCSFFQDHEHNTDDEMQTNTSTLLFCHMPVCPQCARGHVPVILTRTDGLTAISEIFIIDAHGRSPFDPSPLTMPAAASDISSSALADWGRARSQNDNQADDGDDGAGVDAGTRMYIATTDFNNALPFYVAAPSNAVLPRVAAHNHPAADTAVVWSNYYYRVDFTPGSFDPQLPLGIFWGALQLPFYELDNLGFSVLIPHCAYNKDTESYDCPGGRNATMTASVAGLKTSQFLPAAASAQIQRRTRKSTLDPRPLLFHHLSPAVVECGDDVVLTARLHGDKPAPAILALFIPDGALSMVRAKLSRSFETASNVERYSERTEQRSGGMPAEVHSELLQRVTPESLAQAIADLAVLDAAALNATGVGNSSTADEAHTSSWTSFPQPSASVIAAADPVASLFLLSRSHDRSLVLPEAAPDTPRTFVLSEGAEIATLAAVRAAKEFAFRATVQRLPSTTSVRLRLHVLSLDGLCKPTMADMFVFNGDHKLLDVLYTSPGRRLRVMQKPFPGLRVGFVWSTPLPSRPAEREALVNRVLGVISGSLSDHSPERLAALGMDADASVLYFGILPRHRNQSPTPSELSVQIDTLLSDPMSPIRQRLPDLNPEIRVPRVKLYPCPPPASDPGSMDMRYELSCSAPSDEAPPSLLLWYVTAAGGVALLLVIGAGCQYRYRCLRMCSCNACDGCCHCCRHCSESESIDAFADQVDVDAPEEPPSMYNANSSYYQFD